MNSYKSIIYVNFSPYENTGNILDFIKENFESVYSFSFDFHKFKKNDNSNKFRVYRNGEIEYEQKLISIPVSESLIFVLLPIRSVLIFLQIFWHLLGVRRSLQKPVIFFTVNAFTAWVGNLLKTLKLVDKTVFWVWDYYPPRHPNLIIKIMRKIYWYFDKVSIRSDHVVFMNQRLVNLRKRIAALPSDIKYSIIPIGTNSIFKPINKMPSKSIKLAFIGVLKKSQGLDLIFDQAPKLREKFKRLDLHIIGSGPEETYFRKRASYTNLSVKFYNLLSEQEPTEAKKIFNILSRCHIGIAPYIPERSNLSYYGDPSKVKKYLSFGLPIITTNVYEFSSQIENSKAGVIINYHEPKSLVKAVEKIYHNYNYYQKNALTLAKKYYYKRIYPKFFNL